jgi:hypothetical protein
MPMKRTRLPKAPLIPKSRRLDVTRGEFNGLIELLNRRSAVINEIGQQVEKNARNIEVQFTRIAQIQADLDQIKRTLTRLNAA